MIHICKEYLLRKNIIETWFCMSKYFFSASSLSSIVKPDLCRVKCLLILLNINYSWENCNFLVRLYFQLNKPSSRCLAWLFFYLWLEITKARKYSKDTLLSEREINKSYIFVVNYYIHILDGWFRFCLLRLNRFVSDLIGEIFY